MSVRATDSVFSTLSKADLKRLISASRVQDHGTGEVLMQQGEAGDFACLILSGKVAVEVSGDLGVATVATLGRGDLVGELTALTETPRSATIRTTAPTRSLRLERAAILDALRQTPDLALSVIASLGARTEQTNRAITLLTRATEALAKGTYDPEMLDTLTAEAAQVSHFADTFQRMAAEMVEKRTMTAEMQMAAEIQRAFLPTRLPETPLADRFEIAATMTPARNVGGDFYDYFMVDDRRLGFAVGDVSGKGAPAAIFMSVARTVLKTLARGAEVGDAASVLGRVNEALAEDNAEGMFVTLAYGCLDLVTGVLDYASAGHDETYVLREAETQALGALGPACGLFEGAAFRGMQMTLARGDIVVFATDGVTEAFDIAREVYGEARLRALLDVRPLTSPAQIVRGCVTDVADFVADAPPSDDLTLLALRYR